MWIQVQDMGRAVEFYTKVLGAELGHHSPYWSDVTLAGIKLGFHPPLSSDPHTGTPYASWTLGFVTDNILGLKAHLLENQVSVDPRWDETPGGVLMTFFDPDGHPVQAREPGSTLEALGLV